MTATDAEPCRIVIFGSIGNGTGNAEVPAVCKSVKLTMHARQRAVVLGIMLGGVVALVGVERMNGRNRLIMEPRGYISTRKGLPAHYFFAVADLFTHHVRQQS
jgi:hypothetical protein